MGGTSRSAVRDSIATLYNRSQLLQRIHQLYWDLRVHLLDNSIAATVNDTTVEFGVTTRTEFMRATNFSGEREILERFLDEIEGHETVWDVGACIGTYACFAAKLLPNGHVVAFEPEQVNRSRLESNLVRNAPENRWTVTGTALFDHRTEMRLRSEFHEAGAGHHYLDADGDRVVEARAGTALVRSGTPAPDIVKIDVQGAEMQVLQGMAELLDDVTTLYLELHERKITRYDARAADVQQFLRQRGFTVERVGSPGANRSGVSFLRASRPE